MIALTLVRTQSVDASAVIAYIRIALAFVDVDAIVSIASQRESGMTDALETTLQVAARPIATDTRSLVTFIDVNAIALTGSKFVAGRTLALEIALLINALCVSAAGIRYLRTMKITS